MDMHHIEVFLQEAKESPLAKHPSHKLFSSPIQVAEFCDQPKTDSPEIFIEIGSGFKEIIEKEGEESDGDGLIDILGNRIRQFDAKDEDSSQEAAAVVQDKQNETPVNYMKTPLKMKSVTRSPLQDITPSVTHKKTNSKMLSEKARFLTPRTMDKQSSGSGIRKMARI